MTTAEDVKRVLEAYLRERFPKGRYASAMFDTGDPRYQEVLVITPGLLYASDQDEPESLGAPVRNSSK